jgi:hypothetical protein
VTDALAAFVSCLFVDSSPCLRVSVAIRCLVRDDRGVYTSLPMKVVVIIPAAGLGTRMAVPSAARPKQTTKQDLRRRA